MNGEVMDETIETSQVSENASIIPKLVHILGKQEAEEETREHLPDTKAEGASDQEFEKNEQAEEECTNNQTAQCNKNREESPIQGICDEDIQNTKVKSYVQGLDGLLPEGILGAPAITTNGLEKNESNETTNNEEKSPEPEYELENNTTLAEKILNNSQDSMLSATYTDDEMDITENREQIFINHVHNDPSEEDVNKKEIDDVEMESEDSLEEMLGSDLDPQTEETFSIVSGSEYDEVSQGSGLDKNTDVIILENDGPATRNGNSSSPEVHEIQSENEDEDDRVVTVAEVHTSSKVSKAPTDKTELRRSSRTIKRKKYSYEFEENQDDESDVEEVSLNERRKSRPIMINDTKSLVEIAAKQAARSTSASRREPQLVLIGANPASKAATSSPKSCSSSMNASLYQSIVARGTTVTPVPNKASMATQACQTPAPPPPPAILPSLTDDMFVVEAPSFIVPYVYEKPSIEPFKEFVERLGKDLEAQKVKANKELLEKKKIEKEKRHRERQERREKGEEVEDSDEENKKRKMEEKEKRRRQREEDDESWDGSDSTDSEDFKITDEHGTTFVINDSFEEAKDDVDMLPASTSASKSDNYFDCSLGKFFMNIGMSLVQEYVQADLLKQQQRKLQREKKTGQSTKEREVSICLLKKNLELSKENNEPYACPQLKCEHCSFKTESALVLAQHLETPHMKNNMYKCNFCPYEIRAPHDILFHLESEHKIRGKLERAAACHQCVNCPFEDSGKGKLARHIISCAKKFKPDHNLSPPLEWEPPAKIPKVAKARNTMMGAPYPNAFGRQQFGSTFGRVSVVSGTLPPAFRPRGRFPAPPTPRLVQAGGSIVRGSSMLRQNATITNYPVINAKKSQHPSISITPLPRQPAAPPVLHLQAGQNTKGGNFVICEICDGYIKDLDQLRNHMQWIHKVKIHPKMIYNRPPLNCQKCQFRFFTDQGLERHLLGSHGLVTSSMQEAANKSKDAGRCPVCGKVYQWKLLNHVARDHNLTLKPAHLSYKCTVCTATFGMYKLFENHVYSAHSVVAKRVMDKNVPTNKTNNKSTAPKGLKINDEITITAQPAKTTPSANKNK